MNESLLSFNQTDIISNLQAIFFSKETAHLSEKTQ